MTLKSFLMAATAFAALAACATQTPAPTAQAPAESTVSAASPVVKPRPQIGAYGFDMTARDLSVKPGDDFYRHSGGEWLKRVSIPEDRTRWGTFDMLRAESEKAVKAIVEDVSAKGGAPGSLEQKIADYYNSYLDRAAIDAAGLTPIQGLLADIESAKTHADIARLMGRPDSFVGGPISVYISLDEKNPDRYIVGVTHSGLNLPDREFYLKDSDEFKTIRAEYVAHIERMLTLAGDKDAKAKAAKILALETEIAKRHWPREKRRERELTYNLMSKAQLAALTKGFPMEAMLAASGLEGQSEFVVGEKDAMAPLAQLFAKTPVATWRAYLKYQLLHQTASVLPTAFDDENFAFHLKTLNGQPQQLERWKRAAQALDGALGEAVGKIYVDRYFSPRAKAEMEKLVENLRTAYAQRMETVAWMTPETREIAKEKLKTFRVKVGYPTNWRDYAELQVRPGDAFGNLQRSAVANFERDRVRLGRPTDRDEWYMTPQTVNAYYNPVFNEIVFPAAILQPPFFDLNADPAFNYGGIGGVIGHEMGHGFDDQGAKSDARGVLRDWWGPQDVAAFRALGDKLADQYSQFEALPGLKLNGRLGLGENIGDNGGLQVAYEAYKISLGGQPAPVLDGLTGDQRFFYGWGQVWWTLYRDQRLRNQVMTGPHSPPEFRVNGVVRNMDAWYAAFDVQPGDKLYLAPDQRVKIW